ncbi:MAG: radical SAM family heme chaperone HemW [Clostridia bacterium]|nr:radical SAM family heme chaperone HemW [Clostridia bacterium]
MKLPALYIHIPFCAQKCAYCDFASWAGREAAWGAYFDMLENELAHWISRVGNEFSTVFIGGGTPSIVPAEYICRIVRMVKAAEISMEANPGTLSPEKLRAYRKAGVNRLSMGVQSFDDALLRKIGRIHSADEAEAAFNMARDAGFDNINLDLMYALPGQTVDAWRATIERAVKLSPDHISAYSLIIEEGTPIADWASETDEDTVNEMQRLCTGFLAQHGYGRYEISNYAKPGYECRHNICYWTRGDYIGIGCAAHSLFDGRRFCNTSDLEKYLSGVRIVEDTALTETDIIEETVMLGLRMTRGIDIKDVPDMRAAEKMVKGGLAQIAGGRFMLTEAGMELQNAVVLELLG